MLNAGFATLDYLKSRLLPEAGIDETQWDAALSRLGLSVAGSLQRACNRTLERVTDHADTFPARSLCWVLSAYPVEDIASIELRSGTAAFADADMSYNLDEASGLLEFLTAPGTASEQLRVTFTGGYWLDPMDGTAKPAGATVLPDDVLEAWVAQCQATGTARNLFGSVALTDPKAPKFTGELLPEVLAALSPYRRFAV